jgi:pyridoxamine 5'-phosphate oxidase
MPSTADPIAVFEQWFQEARTAGVPEPEAMTLATSSRKGFPSARIVLFKGMSRGGFAFYTNYESRKGRELDSNPRAALVFYWHKLRRQVRVEGRVERLTRAESDRYFVTRERGSQIGAWASNQSSEITGRSQLEDQVRAVEARFEGQSVRRPSYWGGYRVVPERIEFWQGRSHRLHERTVYTRSHGRWKTSLLSP